MNFTEPSHRRKLAPPGWKLEAAETNASALPPTFPMFPQAGFSLRNGLIGYMVQKLVSPKFPEHHQFQQIWSCWLSMPWARSLYISVLLVPSVTAAKRTHARLNPLQTVPLTISGLSYPI